MMSLLTHPSSLAGEARDTIELTPTRTSVPVLFFIIRLEAMGVGLAG